MTWKQGWVYLKFLDKKNPDYVSPAPSHWQHKKKISCPLIEERDPLFNGTMEDILLWRIASLSISQCHEATAESAQQGWWWNGTLTPQTSRPLRLRLCLQLTSSAHLCRPTVKSRAQCISVQRMQWSSWSCRWDQMCGQITKQGASGKACGNPAICYASVMGGGCYYYTPENKPVT